ncbi:hypothetical protein BGZ58_003088, partial [Dissophora ornata]
MVKCYLADRRVVLKNTENYTFENAIRVFIHRIQTFAKPRPCTSSPGQTPALTFDAVKARFHQVCVLQARNKIEQRALQLTRSSGSYEDKVQRHKPSQEFNRYRTIDQPHPKEKEAPEDMGTDAGALGLQAQRPRFSIKVRVRQKTHEPPEAMKQYVWKPWAKLPEKPIDSSSNATNKNKAGATKTPRKEIKKLADIGKVGLVRALGWEHPIVNLDVGTLGANVREVLKDEPALLQEVLRTVREAVHLAARIKRSGQRVIGLYVEQLSRQSVLEDLDGTLLRFLCKSIAPKEMNSTLDDDGSVDHVEDNSDLDGKGDKRLQFLESFLRYLYSGNYPRLKGIGHHVETFIKRLEELGLLEKGEPGAIKVTIDFTPEALTRSAASQLAIEIREMYRNGSYDLHEKLKLQKKKGFLPESCNIEIRKDRSAIENFIHLNKISSNSRRLAPLSPIEHQFLTFSERELAALFWKRDLLKVRLQELASSSYSSIEASWLTLQEVDDWVASIEPGFLIKRLLSGVAEEYPSSRKRSKAGIKAAVQLMSLEEIKKHVELLQQTDFNPVTYNKKGYVLRGSIRTDGFRVQLLAFKLRELQSVRYRRLPDSVLPLRLTTATAGTDYYLTEIHNIIKTKQDVTDLWGCEPEQIDIIGLDLGQACV